jgi:hypothetical protein
LEIEMEAQVSPVSVIVIACVKDLALQTVAFGERRRFMLRTASFSIDAKENKVSKRKKHTEKVWRHPQ